jgi:SAM-dependent methyltransferase
MVLPSAQEVVPFVIKAIKPKSVIDIGCGTGEWLSVFMEHGITDIQGIDGPWADTSQLQIPPQAFARYNFENDYLGNRSYELAMCLEVAEHLYANRAPVLISTLTSLAPIILFSAAIPYQRGVHHVNEQWLDYWVTLFKDKGFVPIDFIRPLIWKNEKIVSHYRQNIIIFCKEDAISNYPNLIDAYNHTNPDYLSFVHPLKYLGKCENMPFMEIYHVFLNRIGYLLHLKKLTSY